MSERERERQRDRVTETKRETKRESDRKTKTETGRQREIMSIAVVAGVVCSSGNCGVVLGVC